VRRGPRRPRRVYAADMADYNAERESEVDPDEAVRAEIRAKLRERDPEKVGKSKRTPTRFEEAEITLLLQGNPGHGAW
jgi:hypothetical protein